MRIRHRIEALFAKQTAELTSCAEFVALEEGRAPCEDYDRFIQNVARTHLQSTRFVAFLYALAPPTAAAGRLRNLLEEISHPGLLRQLVAGTGLGDRLPELEALADDDVRLVVADPLLYGSLKEVGLAALCEVVAFEYLLSRVATRVARALAAHRGLASATLRWWTEHSEVDLAHAEEGLADLEAYVAYYGFTEAEADTIVELTLRENVFIKRYFGELSLARAAGMVPMEP